MLGNRLIRCEAIVSDGEVVSFAVTSQHVAHNAVDHESVIGQEIQYVASLRDPGTQQLDAQARELGNGGRHAAAVYLAVEYRFATEPRRDDG